MRQVRDIVLRRLATTSWLTTCTLAAVTWSVYR